MKERPNHDRKCTAYRTRGIARLLVGLMGELKFLVRTNGLFFINTDHASRVARHPLRNLFAAVYWVQRKFFLKDTGRK